MFFIMNLFVLYLHQVSLKCFSNKSSFTIFNIFKNLIFILIFNLNACFNHYFSIWLKFLPFTYVTYKKFHDYFIKPFDYINLKHRTQIKFIITIIKMKKM